MDTKLIKEFGEEILQYRFRTARHKKRMQYKDFERALIALYKKKRSIRELTRNLGFKPLQPPVQKGWVRSFELREDVARSEKAAFFETLLAKINTREYSWRKDFKKKQRKFGKKIYVVREQYLQKITVDDLKKKGITEEERKYFIEQWEPDWRGVLHQYFVFTEPWRFVWKVKPNMLTKVKVKDVDLESQEQEIENYLTRNALRGKQWRLLNGSNEKKRWRDFVREKEVYRYKNKSLTQILDLIKE